MAPRSNRSIAHGSSLTETLPIMVEMVTACHLTYPLDRLYGASPDRPYDRPDFTSREHLRATHDSARSRYDAFAARGVKLDLTRGKPASAQLDLSAALLALPGESDYLAADGTDTRNYGVLQGLLELRAVLAPLFGLDPQQTVIGDNSSLGLMHDTIAYALLCGTSDGPGPWRSARVSRFSARCPATTGTLRSARTSASR